MMNLPFTPEQFFALFGEYNTAVWPAQVVLSLLAIIAVVLITVPRRWADLTITVILAFLWIWMAIVYHLAFFTQINPMAYGFAAISLIGALIFLWKGVIRRELRFGRVRGLRAGIGATLILYALVIYPLWSISVGHTYPTLPTFGVPCPTTIFTIGVLAFLIKPYPRSVFGVPIVWSAIGGQAVFILGIPQDSGLIVAGVLGLVLMLRGKQPV